MGTVYTCILNVLIHKHVCTRLIYVDSDRESFRTIWPLNMLVHGYKAHLDSEQELSAFSQNNLIFELQTSPPYTCTYMYICAHIKCRVNLCTTNASDQVVVAPQSLQVGHPQLLTLQRFHHSCCHCRSIYHHLLAVSSSSSSCSV